MRIGEVSLLTNDVVRLADFYKKLLDIHNGSDDPVHQTLIGEETMLTIYDDGSEKNNQNQNICLAFTVDDVEKEYLRVVELGAEIIEPPVARPWGAVNMSFRDPDGNVVYLLRFVGLMAFVINHINKTKTTQSNIYLLTCAVDRLIILDNRKLFCFLLYKTVFSIVRPVSRKALQLNFAAVGQAGGRNQKRIRRSQNAERV